MPALLQVLPLAIVMVAGPQIVTAILLATSERPRQNSYAYVGGAVLASTVATCAFYFLAKALNLTGGGSDSSSMTLEWVLVVVLVVAGIRVYLRREADEPPKWMSNLQTASPGSSLRLGLLLFLLMPTDILMTFTVGSFLAANDAPLWHAGGFLLVTALLIGAPLLVLLLMGKRADTVLPKMRAWMSANAWVVSEVVIGFFLVMQVNSILSA